MSPNGAPEIDRPVAFRPDSLRAHDGVLAERQAGYAQATAEGVESRPGAVPPPAPTRPAPREPLAARLRAGFGEG